jgi:hypothetical protein
MSVYEGVSKSFRNGRLERELQMVQLSATRCSCIAILWVSLVSFVAITLCVTSQRVFIVVTRIFRYRLSPETFGYTLVYCKLYVFRQETFGYHKPCFHGFPANDRKQAAYIFFHISGSQCTVILAFFFFFCTNKNWATSPHFKCQHLLDHLLLCLLSSPFPWCL